MISDKQLEEQHRVDRTLLKSMIFAGFLCTATMFALHNPEGITEIGREVNRIVRANPIRQAYDYVISGVKDTGRVFKGVVFGEEYASR